MIVSINGEEHQVKFQHGSGLSPNPKSRVLEETRFTSVIIEKNNQLVTNGSVICDPRENFNREIGRKKALKIALGKKFDRNERTVVWETYRCWGKQRF